MTMSRRCSNAVSLSGKSGLRDVGLRGSSSSTQNTGLDASDDFKTRMIDSVMIPFMSQDWRTIEENMFLFDLFRNEIDLIVLRNPRADIYVYKDLIAAVEMAFEQQQEIACLEKRLYEGREDAMTMVVKLGSIRLRPELELYDLILGKPDYKKGEKHDATVAEDIIKLMKTPRATFANISKYIKHKYRSNLYL